MRYRLARRLGFAESEIGDRCFAQAEQPFLRYRPPASAREFRLKSIANRTKFFASKRRVLGPQQRTRAAAISSPVSPQGPLGHIGLNTL